MWSKPRSSLVNWQTSLIFEEEVDTFRRFSFIHSTFTSGNFEVILAASSLALTGSGFGVTGGAGGAAGFGGAAAGAGDGVVGVGEAGGGGGGVGVLNAMRTPAKSREFDVT